VSVAKPMERFDGFAIARGKDGPATVRMTMRDWVIRNNTRLAPFPERGLLIMQLRAGELVTVIDGERKRRHTDEIWSVPENAVLEIETEKDTAIVQTVSIRSASYR